MSRFPVSPTSRQAIWDFVRNLRRTLGLEYEFYFNIVNFVEKVMPVMFPDFIFEVCTTEEMGNMHGETIPSEHKIRIREDVYNNACMDIGRDRLTMAHEAGHYFMHDEKSIIFPKSAGSGKIPTFCDPEWQTNVFAGELLAPSYLIDGLPAYIVQKRCSVSFPCADRQLSAIESERSKQNGIVIDLDF